MTSKKRKRKTNTQRDNANMQTDQQTKQKWQNTVVQIERAFETLKEKDESIPKEVKLQDFIYGRMYNPLSQNDLMKNLNIDVKIATKENVEKALNNPVNSEEELIGYNQSQFFSNMSYKEQILDLKNLLSFDLSIDCIDAKKKDYKSKNYQEDEAIVKEYIDKFDYRKEFSDIVENLLLSESYPCFFREFEEGYIFQGFPLKYTKITGKFTHGLIADIDLTYFMQGIVDFRLFPESVKKKYVDAITKSKDKDYRPSQTINKRTGQYATWVQMSPKTDKFWYFKFDTAHNLNVPLYTASLPDVVLIPILRELLQNQNIIAAKKIISSEIPFLQDLKSSVKSNGFAVQIDTLMDLIGLFAHGLEDILKIIPMPTKNIEGIEFKNTAENAYENYMSIISQILSGGTSQVNMAQRQNVQQTSFAIDKIENLASSVYPQFGNFLTYNINLKTKKHKFKATFSGINDQYYRKRQREEVMGWADKGIVLPNKIANSLRLNKYELKRQLEEAKATGFSDDLLLMLNVNIMSNNKTGGRPQKDDGELSNSRRVYENRW